MNNRTLLYLSALLIFLGATTTALADVPPRINFQGTLLDSEGNPVTIHGGTIRFFIYDQPTGGEWKWFEMQAVTTDAAGQFSVVLGTNEDIIDTVFNSPDRWLEIQVSSDPPMTPRIQLVSVGYAFRVSTVDGSTGGTITGDVSIQSDLDVDGDLRVTGKATIGSGHTNAGQWTFVAGSNNEAMADHVAVGGGQDNQANSAYSVVAGGQSNTTTGMNSTIGGGKYNVAEGDSSAIAGGSGNLTQGAVSAIGGGWKNHATGDYSTILGGRDNVAGGVYSSVGGGLFNRATDIYGTIAGGDSNMVNRDFGTVGGGFENSVNSFGGTIAGGYRNNVDINSYGAVGGGLDNAATGASAVVAGGTFCSATGNYSSVGGGNGNQIEGGSSCISGGSGNRIGGDYSCIPGGEKDTVIGHHSMAFGYGVYNPHNDAALFYDGSNPGHLYVNRDRRDEGMIVFLHPLRVGTNTGNGNGAYLSEGGTWFNGSSRAFKENSQPLDGEELLAKIAALPVQSWNYKGTDEQHIGPVAEDFVAAFNVGTAGADGARENKYLSHGDVAGVALRGVQELTQQLAEKTKQAEQLETRVAQLETMIQKLMAERR